MTDFLQQEFWSNTVESYMWALGALLLVFLFQRYIARLIIGAVYRLLNNWLVDADKETFINILLPPFQAFLVIIALLFIVQTLYYPAAWCMQLFDTDLEEILKRVYQLILAITITWMLFRMVDFLYLVGKGRTDKTRTRVDEQFVLYFKDFTKLALFIISCLLISSNVFNFNVSAILAGAGIAGIAIALAAKESLENLLASFIIFIEQPFTIGDYVEVSDTAGIVEKVGFRSTRLRTFEKTFVTIPNRKMIDSPLDNMSLRSLRRVNFSVGLVYDTSPEQLKAIIAEIKLFIEEYKHTDELVTVVFDQFGDSSLDIVVQYYLVNASWPFYMEQKEVMNFKIMEIVKKHGSDFAYPTRTVYSISGGK